MKNTISKVVRFSETDYRYLLIMAVDLGEQYSDYLTKETRDKVQRLRMLYYCDSHLVDFSPSKAIQTLPFFQELYFFTFNGTLTRRVDDFNRLFYIIYELLNTHI